MSESTTQTPTELASQYSVQVTGDLERNAKEQERITGEIADLQRQLAALQHDHALLVTMQQALGITAEAAPSPAGSEEPAASAGAGTPATADASKADALPAEGSVQVPAPRGGAATETSAPAERKRSRKTAASSRRASASKTSSGAAAKAPAKQASKPAAKPTAKQASKPTAKQASKPVAKPTAKAPAKTAGKTAGKAAAKKAPAQPTLVELVRGHLGEQKEPRSAAEVAAALGQAHPERPVKTTVVRTTLEGLVARNQAQRSKQGTSVYYTASEAPAQQPAAAAQPPASGSDD
ncbi:hypothetical protein [Streptomyces sp. NPDC087512]|uniref:hypothetical protein n=1 Tax=unclassified Streptomyces TaxID=2593676 RepID=UPI0034143CB5